MRKLVVAVVVLFAIFTLIRDLPADSGTASLHQSTAQLRSALIP